MNVFNVFRKTSVVWISLVGLCLFACKSVQKSVDVNKVYFSHVDEYPLFNGEPAEEGFYKYVRSYTSYPPKAYENRITGRVFIEFIVERDGSISNTKVVGGADPMLEAEALRIVNSSSNWTPSLFEAKANTSPNWIPGKIDGKTVRMRYTLPINFRIGDKIEKSSSKKAKLSKETILLKEVDLIGFGASKGDYVPLDKNIRPNQ